MEVLLDSDRAGLSRTTIGAVEAETGMTALHFAAAKGQLEMVKFLLKRGAGTDCDLFLLLDCWPYVLSYVILFCLQTWMPQTQTVSRLCSKPLKLDMDLWCDCCWSMAPRLSSHPQRRRRYTSGLLVTCISYLTLQRIHAGFNIVPAHGSQQTEQGTGEYLS
jgi:hypothetical protein